MARVLSTPTTITVNSAQTQLAYEASLTAPGEYRGFEGTDLRTRIPHPYNGRLVNVTEDGGSDWNTAIDWGSMGCYDPVHKRVMWACHGQGNQGLPNTSFRNTHAIFDETWNGGEGHWYAIREFNPPPSDTIGMMHHLGNCCMDPNRRRMYKSKYHQGVVFVCNIDTLEWIGCIDDPIQGSFDRAPGMVYVPTIGTHGALWAWAYSGGKMQLEEKLIPEVEVLLPTVEVAPYAWRIIASNVAIGFTEGRGLPMAYNTRSNKVMCGGEDAHAYIFDCANPTPLTTMITIDSSSINATWHHPQDGHLCNDPVNDGWLYKAQNGHMYRISASGTITDLGAAPGLIGSPTGLVNILMTPIEPYGVVWMVGDSFHLNTAPYRAYLYKPAVA